MQSGGVGRHAAINQAARDIHGDSSPWSIDTGERFAAILIKETVEIQVASLTTGSFITKVPVGFWTGKATFNDLGAGDCIVFREDRGEICWNSRLNHTDSVGAVWHIRQGIFSSGIGFRRSCKEDLMEDSG